MTINLQNNLVGLSLLGGTNSFASFQPSAFTFESLAVRKAKAAFTTVETVPPWKSGGGALAMQASAVRALATIIDKNQPSNLPPDVATSFTAYNALDKLRILAEAAAKTATPSMRQVLEDSFARGLSDLQSYLATAPSDKVNLVFDQPSARAQTVGINETKPGTIYGKGVATARDAPLDGLTGSEVLTVKIARGTMTDTIRVDLSTTPQPPSLDSVSDALNAAIAAVPQTDSGGAVVLDGSGNPVPRWKVSFAPDKSSGSWGLRIDNPAYDTVSLDQENAPDALMVATGLTAQDSAATTKLVRFDDPTGAFTRHTLGEITSLDELATERAELAAKDIKTVEGVDPPSTDVYANTTAAGIVTDASGASYVVGTAKGDMGSNLLAGESDLFLTKVDSEGRVLWQRALGAAGSAEGAGVALAPDGGVVVTGTVKGNFDASPADGDVVVTKFDANGDEQFSTLVRSLGADTASAVAVGTDGSIYVGGQSASRDATIARIDSNGVVSERRTIDSGSSDSLTALAVDSDGSLVVLTREGTSAMVRRIDSQNLATDLGSYNLGSAQATGLTIAPDGTIAVAGTTTGTLNGSPNNSLSGASDGFLARVSSGLSSANVTYVGTSATDRIDSVSYMNGSFYVGGRTGGDLEGTRSGTVDAFVAQIDASGAVANINQFGVYSTSAEPVRVSAVSGGASVLGSLGLSRGTVSAQDSTKLTAQTGLRPGDQFSIRLNDGVARTITISASYTLDDLAKRIRLITGSKANVTTPLIDGVRTLRIDAKAGNSIEFISGKSDRDALSKLGIPAARISAPEIRGKKDPIVTPGGRFGLDLSFALDLSTKEGAAQALAKIKSAISMTQTAYRSLYWDSAKAARVDGTNGVGGGSPYWSSQLARYQDALNRISVL